MTPDELPVGAATPELTPEPAAPAKPGRKPAVPKPVDTRTLAERVKEAFEELRAADAVRRGELRKLDALRRDRRDIDNRIAAAGAAIQRRDRWLEKEAVRLIQKETGIRTIPGYTSPQNNGLSAWLAAKKETMAKVRAARLAVMQTQAETPPTT